MLDILSDRTYRHLFAAQVVALMGTGLGFAASALLVSVWPCPHRGRCRAGGRMRMPS